MKTRTLARCTAPRAPCDWRAEGPDADREAARHTKTTGHATTCETWPIAIHLDAASGAEQDEQTRDEKDDEREKP